MLWCPLHTVSNVMMLWGPQSLADQLWTQHPCRCMLPMQKRAARLPAMQLPRLTHCALALPHTTASAPLLNTPAFRSVASFFKFPKQPCKEGRKMCSGLASACPTSSTSPVTGTWFPSFQLGSPGGRLRNPFLRAWWGASLWLSCRGQAGSCGALRLLQRR